MAGGQPGLNFRHHPSGADNVPHKKEKGFFFSPTFIIIIIFIFFFRSSFPDVFNSL
jgi:hypothetical protein